MLSINFLILVASVNIIGLLDMATANVKFYGGSNKSPFDVFSVESRDYDCKPISEVRKMDQFPTKFVITETCIIAYENPNCETSGWSMKVTPPGVNFDKQPNSFRRCKVDEDAPQLDVFLVSYSETSVETQEVVETYRHVCSCENLPEYVQEMEKWSINNYGNKLFAYFQPDCLEKEWEPIALRQGNHLIEKHISKSAPSVVFSTIDKPSLKMIKSFGPDPNSTYFKTRCLSPETFTEVFEKRVQIVEALKSAETKLETLIQATGPELRENKNVLEKVCLLKQLVSPFDLIDIHPNKTEEGRLW